MQARIRARREARRAQAIHDAYSHPYEVFVGGGYQRFTPGPTLQRTTMYAWDVALTRYWSEKLGLTFDVRGNYGTAFVGLNETSLTRPAISHYDFMVGPTYRFRMRPKYSIAGNVKGGLAMSNFASDTNKFGTSVLGLYPDGTTYAINASSDWRGECCAELVAASGAGVYGDGVRVDAAERSRVYVRVCVSVWKAVGQGLRDKDIGTRDGSLSGEPLLFAVPSRGSRSECVASRVEGGSRFFAYHPKLENVWGPVRLNDTRKTSTFMAHELFVFGVCHCRMGMLAMRCCHSAGPVWWTLVPLESTATVTGMSLTSNS